MPFAFVSVLMSDRTFATAAIYSGNTLRRVAFLTTVSAKSSGSIFIETSQQLMRQNKFSDPGRRPIRQLRALPAIANRRNCIGNQVLNSVRHGTGRIRFLQGR